MQFLFATFGFKVCFVGAFASRAREGTSMYKTVPRHVTAAVDRRIVHLRVRLSVQVSVSLMIEDVMSEAGSTCAVEPSGLSVSLQVISRRRCLIDLSLEGLRNRILLQKTRSQIAICFSWRGRTVFGTEWSSDQSDYSPCALIWMWASKSLE